MTISVVGLLLAVGCDSRKGDPQPQAAPTAPVAPVAAAPQSRPSSPQQVVADAIAACCGDADLEKFNVGRTKAKVRSEQLLGFSMDGTVTEVYHLPGRSRREVEGRGQDRRGDHTVKVTYLWNGEWGWTTGEDGRLHKVPASVPASNFFPAPYLGQLAVLKDPGTQLYLSSQTEWRGRPVNVLHVLTPDGRRADAMFDPATKLLIGTRRDLADPTTPTGDTAPVDTEFSDFRDVHGMRLPMSTVAEMKGKPIFDVTVLEFDPLETVDESLFVGPDEEH